MSRFSLSRRPADSLVIAAPKPNKPFWRSDASAAQLSSEAETIKLHQSPSANVGVQAPTHYRAQPVPVPEITTFHKQNQHSSTFNVVRSSNPGYPPLAPRGAASTTTHNHPEAYFSGAVNHQQQQYSASLLQKGTSSSKQAVPSVSHSPHRISVQSLNSLNTISTTTSRSSVDQVSIDNLQHSWDSNTLSTAPSSTVPRSTESLVRIPTTSEPRDREGPVLPLDRSMGTSRVFPLVESDGQRRPTTHAYTAGEQASNALPLPNSEYESPARVRSLRRTRAQIISSSTPGTAPVPIPSVRDATPTAGRASPTPAHRPPSPPKPQQHRRTQSEIPFATEMSYRGRSEDHGKDHRAPINLLSRVMASSSGTPRQTHSSSTASTHTNMQQPRVASTSQSANPNMTKLKQTSIPRIGTSNGASASPMVEHRASQYTSLHSPRQASLDSTQPSWSSLKSPTMTSSVSAHPPLAPAAVMSPNLSTLASPRTLISDAHHTADIRPILPSHLHYASSAVGNRGSVFIDQNRDSGASTVTATPSSPASQVVRTLFSSLTSRQHRHSTPQPSRASGLSNPPITAQEVSSPRLAAAAAGILSPPPLPPQSTRPDAPQQGFGPDASQFNPTSPRHSTAEFTKSAHCKPATESRLEGLRSPSSNQSSILRSYGLDSNTTNPETPISGSSHRVPLGTPYHPQSRTLMSDSEVTTVTTVSVTRSTVVSQATATHLGERRSSSAAPRRASTQSTTSRSASQQQQQQQYAQHPQSPQQQQQQQLGGFFNMFRPKSPKAFPSMDRSASPAPPLPPPPSKTPPPRAATASPRRFGFTLPMMRHKPKKSISGASVEAVIGGTLGMANDSARSSRGSLRRSTTPEVPYNDYPGSTVTGVRYSSATRNYRRGGDEDTQDEGDDYLDYADRDGDDNVDIDEGLMEDKMRAVQDWSHTTEQNWQQSGKRRARPGVSFDIPASESEKDDGGHTLVSAVRGAGRVLRYQRQFQATRQFSDAEFVY